MSIMKYARISTLAAAVALSSAPLAYGQTVEVVGGTQATAGVSTAISNAVAAAAAAGIPTAALITVTVVAAGVFVVTIVGEDSSDSTTSTFTTNVNL